MFFKDLFFVSGFKYFKDEIDIFFMIWIGDFCIIRVEVSSIIGLSFFKFKNYLNILGLYFRLLNECL